MDTILHYLDTFLDTFIISPLETLSTVWLWQSSVLCVHVCVCGDLHDRLAINSILIDYTTCWWSRVSKNLQQTFQHLQVNRFKDCYDEVRCKKSWHRGNMNDGQHARPPAYDMSSTSARKVRSGSPRETLLFHTVNCSLNSTSCNFVVRYLRLEHWFNKFAVQC